VLTAATEPLGILQLADELGVHPNTVRMHLGALVSQGRAERVAPERHRPGRPPLLFRAVPKMDPTGPRNYRLLAEILTGGLAARRDPAGAAFAAGRRWGGQLALFAPTPTGDRGAAVESGEPTDRLVALLDDLGFAPERRDVERKPYIGLRHCPFLELAETRAQVVCPVHLGLMQSALEAWGASVTVDRLDAFVEPDLCLARLVPVGAGR
jgi:predicted ArsR family transcriptional regulator